MMKNYYFLAIISVLIAFGCGGTDTDNAQQKVPSFVEEFNAHPKIDSTTQFSLDGINGIGIASATQPIELSKMDDTSLHGWAVDAYANDLAREIYVKVGENVYKADYHHDRADVAQVLGNPNYAKSGFSCTITKNSLPTGLHDLSIWVLKKDGSGVYKPNREQNLLINVK